MTETPLPDAQPAHAVPEPGPDPELEAGRALKSQGRNGTWNLVLALLLLVLIGACAYGGWWLWQERETLTRSVTQQADSMARQSDRLDALESQNVEMSTRQADLSRQADRGGTELGALQTRIDDSLGLIGRISEELSGGRTRFQLISLEHLLLLAADRLLLERDAAGALAALEIVDQRLAALADPRLFPVREAVAQERAALLAVPQPDLVSATLSLSSVIERVPQLPLVAHVPSHFEAPDRRADQATDGTLESGWQRLLASVQTTLRSLFTVRRQDPGRSHQLLPPEAEALVYQVLVLKLEGARVALLRRDTVALRDVLRSADAWLDQQFKPDDPGVLAARGEIARLQALELAPNLPDTGRSLAVLRALVAQTPADERPPP